MKRTYLAGMLAYLIDRSAHSGIASVVPWQGPNPTPTQTGMHLTFTNGAELFIKVIGTSGPGGGHSDGPDRFDPAHAPGDVAGIGGDGPYRAAVFLGFVCDLLEACRHAEVGDVRRPRPDGQVSATITLPAGHKAHLIVVRAVGPGGKPVRVPDYEVDAVMR